MATLSILSILSSVLVGARMSSTTLTTRVVNAHNTPKPQTPTPTILQPDRDTTDIQPQPLAGTMPTNYALPPNRDGIILFDGVCNFCNRWVSFVLDNDPNGKFAFASLQSDYGRRTLELCGRDADDLSTFVVVDKTGFHTRSSAALRVGAILEVPALNAAAAAAELVPSPLRDGVYGLVAENRYSILGKDESGGPESCKLRADSALVAERFLG